MQRTILNSKIHRATVTQSDLNYIGSISIDEDLMQRSGLLENEQVHVLNLENGARIITYVIPAKSKSGIIGINGAAAHLFSVGDKVIICSYVQLENSEISKHKPQIILVNASNQELESLDLLKN